MAKDDAILAGWKEIGRYLCCSVPEARRRARRGMPVYYTRAGSGGRQKVTAFRGELAEWIRKNWKRVS